MHSYGFRGQYFTCTTASFRGIVVDLYRASENCHVKSENVNKFREINIRILAETRSIIL